MVIVPDAPARRPGFCRDNDAPRRWRPGLILSTTISAP